MVVCSDMECVVVYDVWRIVMYRIRGVMCDVECIAMWSEWSEE